MERCFSKAGSRGEVLSNFNISPSRELIDKENEGVAKVSHNGIRIWYSLEQNASFSEKKKKVSKPMNKTKTFTNQKGQRINKTYRVKSIHIKDLCTYIYNIRP